MLEKILLIITIKYYTLEAWGLASEKDKESLHQYNAILN